MSPEERALLKYVGLIALQNLTYTTSATLLYGPFVVVFGVSTSILLKRGLEFKSTQVMFGTTLASFLLMTLHWGSYIAGYALGIKGVLLDSAGTLPPKSIRGVKLGGLAPTIIQIWAQQLLPIIGDGVVIWRAWVLYSQQRWIILVPCSLLLGTIATSLGYAIMHFFLASMALSLATNAVTTLLILYKLWAHRQFIRRMGVKQKSMSLVQNVLIGLVESGFVLCALQLLNFILRFVPGKEASPVAIASVSIFGILQLFTAMYPSIVIVIINRKRTMAKTFGFSSKLKGREIPDFERVSEGPMTPSALSFALPSKRVTTPEVSASELTGITSYEVGKDVINMTFIVPRSTEDAQHTRS